MTANISETIKSICGISIDKESFHYVCLIGLKLKKIQNLVDRFQSYAAKDTIVQLKLKRGGVKYDKKINLKINETEANQRGCSTHII